MTPNLSASATFDLSKIDTGATAWVLASAALVLLMTPGLAFFYGGMVRRKNVLGMLMQNFATIAIVSVVWVLVSFSIAFGHGNGLFGGLHFAGLQNMTEVVPGYTGAAAQVIPPMVFVVFQLMFAVITPALITGSTADRWKFGAFVAFVAIWSILVYAPVAHWVFSPEGWLFKRGALDFAGGTVVHINAGAAGLAMALVLGKRRGWPQAGTCGRTTCRSSCSVPACCGSAGSASTPAPRSAPTTWPATPSSTPTRPPRRRCSAGSLVEKIGTARHDARCGFGCRRRSGRHHPGGGLRRARSARSRSVCSPVCSARCAIGLKSKLGFDDSLDVVGVHLVGGIVGSLSVGLFATIDTNPAGKDGLFYGGGAAPLGGAGTGRGLCDGVLVRDDDHHRQGDRALHQEPAHRGRGGRRYGPRVAR